MKDNWIFSRFSTGAYGIQTWPKQLEALISSSSRYLKVTVGLVKEDGLPDVGFIRNLKEDKRIQHVSGWFCVGLNTVQSSLINQRDLLCSGQQHTLEVRAKFLEGTDNAVNFSCMENPFNSSTVSVAWYFCMSKCMTYWH